MSTSLPPPKRKAGCWRFGCLPILVIAAVLFVATPSFKAIEGWWIIYSALSHAKSVELVHYNPYSHIVLAVPEIVYGKKSLKPEEFSKVAWAFPPCLDFGMPTDPYLCTFDPHHRIVIKDASGHETVIRVCFLCDHVQIGDRGEIFCTPFIWRPLLHHLFEEEGLPYTPDRYIEDYQKAGRQAVGGH